MVDEILNNNKDNNVLWRSMYHKSFAFYFPQPKEDI